MGDKEIKRRPPWLSGKNLPATARDTGNADLIPGSGRCPGGGNSNILQYSCLRNPTDRGAWEATFHGVKSELDTTWWLNNKIFSNQDKLLSCTIFLISKFTHKSTVNKMSKTFPGFSFSQAPSWLGLALTATTPTKRKYNFTLFNYSFISSVFLEN